MQTDWRDTLKYSPELCRGYEAISKVYGLRRTKRSGVLLMQHIDDGLAILNSQPYFSSTSAWTAYAVHPLFQDDESLRSHTHLFHQFSGYTCALIMEYRSVANAHLSDRWQLSAKHIHLSPLQEVNNMLIADKLQNFRDFMKYHRHSHARALELLQYFHHWCIALSIEHEFERIVAEEGPQHDGTI